MSAFLNDYKNSFTTRNYNSIKYTIAFRPALDATRQDIIVSNEISKKVNDFLCSKNINLKKNLMHAIFSARFQGESWIIIQSSPENGDDYGVKSELNSFVNSISVVNRLTKNKDGSFSMGEISGIHASRVFEFYGEKSHDGANRTAWEVVQEEIDLYYSVVIDAARVVKASSIPIIQTPDLNDMIERMAKDGKSGTSQSMKDKVSAINKDLKNSSLLMLDKDDSFVFSNRSIAGITELTNEIKGIIAGATLPELILFDKMPQGLAGSRKEQLESYYNIVNYIREIFCTPVINALISAKFGVVDWEYAHLTSPTEIEVEQVKSAKIDNVVKLSDLLSLMPEQVLMLAKSQGLVADDFEIEQVDDFGGLLDEESEDQE